MLARIYALTALLAAGCGAAPSAYETRVDDWKRASQAARSEEAPPVLDQDSGLDDYLALAQLHNPGLQAAFQYWKAALERVPQATSLPNPTLTFSAYVLGEIQTRNGPIQGRIGLTQAFPWFGKLAAAGGREFEASEAAREEFEARRREVIRTVRNTWYEYAHLAQAVAITDGNLELLRYWEEVARIRYASSLGTHADVIRAQVELGKLEDRLATLRDLRRPLTARINAAMNRRPEAEIPWPDALPEDPVRISDRELVAGLEETSPVLRAMRHRVRSAGYGVTVAEKNFYPDFVIGADYNFVGSTSLAGAPNSGQDALGIGIGLQLPIWVGRNQAGLREAEALQNAAASELAQARNTFSAEAEMALYRFRDADRRLALFRDTLIPKGEESLQATSTAYEAGTATFLEFIDTQRVLLEFQLSVARAAADRAQALAEVERISGLDLLGDA